MMKRAGHIFVISAPSGTGKSTLIDLAVQNLPDLWHSVSATTRKPREYEKEGIHYFFLNHQEFQEKIVSDQFLEWAEVHGEYYGTPSKEIDRHLHSGQDVIMDLDVQGALQVKRKRPDAILVFIKPPSLEVLRERLAKRNTETEERIQKRLSIAQNEIAHSSHYDHIIVNKVLDKAYSKLAALILETRKVKAEGENPLER